MDTQHNAEKSCKCRHLVSLERTRHDVSSANRFCGQQDFTKNPPVRNIPEDNTRIEPARAYEAELDVGRVIHILAARSGRQLDSTGSNGMSPANG